MDIFVFWLVVAFITLILMAPKFSSRNRILLFVFLPLIPLLFALSQFRSTTQVDKSGTIKRTSATVTVGSGTGIGIANILSALFQRPEPEPELPLQPQIQPQNSDPAEPTDSVWIAQVSAHYPDNAANLRRTPNGTVIMAIRNGTTVTILSNPVDSEWVRVQYGENEGWIYRQLLVKPYTRCSSFSKSGAETLIPR